MIAYTYKLELRNVLYTCRTIPDVVKIINKEMGYEIVTEGMVGNYLTRPHLANKKLFKDLIQLTRERRYERFRRRKPQLIEAIANAEP